MGAPLPVITKRIGMLLERPGEAPVLRVLEEDTPERGEIVLVANTDHHLCEDADLLFVCESIGDPYEATIEAVRQGRSLFVGVPKIVRFIAVTKRVRDIYGTVLLDRDTAWVFDAEDMEEGEEYALLLPRRDFHDGYMAQLTVDRGTLHQSCFDDLRTRLTSEADLEWIVKEGVPVVHDYRFDDEERSL